MDKTTFIANQRHILFVHHGKINLDEDNDFDENHSDTFIHVRRLAWYSKLKNTKQLSKELMLVS